MPTLPNIEPYVRIYCQKVIRHLHFFVIFINEVIVIADDAIIRYWSIAGLLPQKPATASNIEWTMTIAYDYDSHLPPIPFLL